MGQDNLQKNKITHDEQTTVQSNSHSSHDNDTIINDLSIETNMLKFPRPRILLENQYPDLTDDLPTVVKSIIKTVKPEENSDLDQYINSSIKFLKDQQRLKQSIEVNQCIIGSNLYFIPITINQSEEVIPCLVDTGATNSLLHISVAKHLNLKLSPTNLRLVTATGESENAIQGIAHIDFNFLTDKKEKVTFCTSIIVSSQLNGLKAILGAEFLLDPERVHSITGSGLRIYDEHDIKYIPMCKGISATEFKTNIIETVKRSMSTEEKQEKLSRKTCSCKESLSFPDDIVSFMSHNIKDALENETLPPANELFNDNLELDHKVLDKIFSIYDGDFTHTPVEHKSKLIQLLLDFKDRFSRTKLDLEQTDLYTASLPTLPNKKVCQTVRRLPHNKFQFAMKAIKQLQAAGVVSESDSSWRSNVVMVPKPSSGTELRQNTKADQIAGKQNSAELFRICLDFRELNSILDFPKQTQFTTIDAFLQTLKGKVVVSLDISSSFFIIPIRPEDRYKTAFWVNENSFEFNACVMGLKSSPYHLNKFLALAYSPEAYKIAFEELSEEEKKLVPEKFEDFIKNYFDDFFVYASNYDILYACLKLVLIASRRAKIKFSIEKSVFFTTTFKILGYQFDTSQTILAMDKLKASALINMKKPSSLYELHSRLASFQYQSHFLPFLKHIIYPLHFLLRKKDFNWGPIEEQSWQQAKALVSMSLKLTIPDPEDELVLTTDASKIAASACLFRVKDGQLQIVSVSSKYFSTADLNKNSYTLESISLAYALKVFAPYLLNCVNKIKIFTDAKSLIYAKRMSTHSILMNNTLNYLTNFVSLLDVELYHIPGSVNVLADVLSRAVADNLNCSLPREHPLSRTWAKHLPPLPENLTATRDVLYKFLTEPLSSEPQDLYDRTHRRLMEPKTLQQAFDLSKEITPEQKYYSAVTLLEQWNSKYAKENAPVTANIVSLFTAKAAIDLEKQKFALLEIEKIMTEVFPEIRNTPLYKQIQKNLVEASKRFLTASADPLSQSKLRKLQDSTTAIADLMTSKDVEYIRNQIKTTQKNNFIAAVNTLDVSQPKVFSDKPVVYYKMADNAKFRPKICDMSNGIDLPFQENILLRPNELKKVNLGVRFKLPKGHCALIMNKSSARISYYISVTLGLIDIGFTNYLQTVIQNMSDKDVVLTAGMAVAQLLVIPSHIPEIVDSWSEPDSSRGAFGSTGQNFENIDVIIHKTKNTLPANPVECYLHELSSSNPLLTSYNILNQENFQLENMTIKLLGDGLHNSQTAFYLQDFEAKLIQEEKRDTSIHLPLIPETLQVYYTKLPAAITDLPPPESPSLSDEALKSLLAADLAENRKLTLDSLIYFQTTDPLISKIKDSLLGSSDLKTFVLKKNIVCKIFQPRDNTQPRSVIYLPTVLLLPTIIYVHRFYLHTSISQTFKQFALHYYHPHARKYVSKVCNSCIICTIARNPEKRNVPTGTNRSFQPNGPREMISADIIYMPNSSAGHTHALLISDLFSMYLSFFPLKSKSSSQVATAFRSFFSYQGVPKVVYSDNDTAFVGETSQLFAQFNVKHASSFPYTQKENTVEAQVRRFKNAYRGAILNNPIFSHRDWHTLYPLVIIRLNSTISRYGISREMLHFKDELETHLPIITDMPLTDDLKSDFDTLAKDFQIKIRKYMRNREKSKLQYKSGKQYNFYLHELVMRKIYNPSSAIHPVFTGPYRIMEIFPLGALLKDPRTGETLSVHFQYLRKLSFDEFIQLLPANFDHEILRQVGMSRYNTTGPVEKPRETNEQINDSQETDPLTEIENNFQPTRQGENQENVILPPTPDNERILRSGRIIRINLTSIQNSDFDIKSAEFSSGFAIPPQKPPPNGSILRPPVRPSATPYAAVEQTLVDDLWCFATDLRTENIRDSSYYKTRFKSKYSSAFPGNLVIQLEPSLDYANRKVQFKTIYVHFY